MDIFIAVLFFAFSTTITPGPNNVMIMSSGVNYGIKACLPHYLGICLGFPLMMLSIVTVLQELWRFYFARAV